MRIPFKKPVDVDKSSVDDEMVRLRLRNAISKYRVQNILNEVRRVERVTSTEPPKT